MIEQRRDSAIARLFALDSRSLACARIALAAIVLADLAIRAGDLSAFYADSGLMPRVAWMRAYPNAFSLHAASGHPAFQALLFAVHAVAAGMLLVGLRTRWATFVTWLLLISLQARNPAILQAGDTLLGCFLFWSMFVPLGTSFSIDAALARPAARGPSRVLSVGTVALALQMPLVYFFTALLKGGPEWHSRFDAIQGALTDDFIASPLGGWLAHSLPERLLRGMTVLVLITEVAVPVLLLMPIRTAAVRTVVLPLLIALQLGFLCCLRIGLFPFISTVGVLVLVPSEVWHWLGARAQSGRAAWLRHLAGRRLVRPRARVLRALRRVGGGAVSFQLGRVGSAVCALALAFALVDNVSSVAERPLVPRAVQQIGRSLHIRQSWKMFVRSSKVRKWFVLEGTLEDGRRVDLLRGIDEEPSGARPEHISDVFKNYRWRKYFGNVAAKRGEVQRRALAGWLCRSGNEGRADGERVVHISAYRYTERADAPPGALPPRRSKMFGKRCPLPGERREERRVALSPVGRR